MTIETKFNVGRIVYYVYGIILTAGIIKKVQSLTDTDGTQMYYLIDFGIGMGEMWYKEDVLFKEPSDVALLKFLDNVKEELIEAYK